MKVSVLIPLYNSENYITEAIESVLQQSYSNIEIVIVDDGSTDDSYSIAKAYETDNIKVIQQENSGASAARNTAFRHSTGDLIQYLDADDLLHPDKLKYQVEVFQNENNDHTISSGLWGRFEDNMHNTKWENPPINKDYNAPEKWLIDSWKGLGMATLHAWLVPRNLILQVGPWNESLSLNDDGEFFCRVLLRAHTIKHVPESKVYYRSNMGNSLSQQRSSTALASELHSYELYATHLLEKDSSLNAKRALGNNYMHFIYNYSAIDKNLTLKAEELFNELKVGPMWPVGGGRFKRLAMVLGFKRALKIKALFNF